jgi:tetratricopeptide (TPR) repeat protein
VSLEGAEQEQLFARTGGLPLAIVWSIGLIGLGGSVESVLRRLGSGQSDIARFCFDESVAQIRGRDAHKLLLALSLFASDASREALGIVAGLGEDEFGRDIGLEELLRLSLVNKDGERFSLLPLTKSFVQAEAAKQGEWMEGAREHWQSYFYSLGKTIREWSRNWDDYNPLERELMNIFTVIDSFVSRLVYQETSEGEKAIAPSSIPQAEMIVNFMSIIIRLCRLRGYWSDAEKLCLIARDIGSTISDVRNTGWSCYDLGRISYFRDDIDAAERWMLEAITEWKRDEYQFKKRACFASCRLGLVELRRGNLGKAAELLTTALDDYKRGGGQGSLSYFMESLGDLGTQQGDFTTAISWYQQAIEIARDRNNLPSLASNLLSVGRVKLATADSTGAKDCYDESLKLARECGSISVISGALYSIAALEFSQNQRAPAESHARQALDLFRRLGMKREQVEAEALLARLGDETAEPLNP